MESAVLDVVGNAEMNNTWTFPSGTHSNDKSNF